MHKRPTEKLKLGRPSPAERDTSRDKNILLGRQILQRNRGEKLGGSHLGLKGGRVETSGKKRTRLHGGNGWECSISGGGVARLHG